MSEQHPQDQQETSTTARRTVGIIVGVVLILIIAAGVWWWLTTSDQSTKSNERFEPPAQPAESTVDKQDESVSEDTSEPDTIDSPQPTAQPEPEPEPTPEPEPEPAPELPALDKSTPTVLQTLDSSGIAIQPLKSSRLIRDAVVIVDNLRNGTLVRERTVVQRPDGRFQVIEIEGDLYIDEQSYQRYDALVDWVVSLEGQALVDNYQLFKPLLNEAFAEIGYPNTEFNTALFEAIDVLLATPVPESLVQVKDDEVMYTYANPAYEALPPAQKQLLRMGPDNIRRIKAKLRELKEVFRASL